MRRTRKASLILTVLEESRMPYVFIDVRGIARSRRDLYTLLSRALSEFIRGSPLRRQYSRPSGMP